MEIICSFKEVDEYNGLFDVEDAKKKYGRYDAGNLNVKGLGHDKWAVVATLLPERQVASYMEEGLTLQEVVDGCFEHLNQPPTRRSRKPKYGLLSPRYYVYLEKEGTISVSFTTTDRNNKYFWGRGRKQSGRKLSKRGRPRKK